MPAPRGPGAPPPRNWDWPSTSFEIRGDKTGSGPPRSGPFAPGRPYRKWEPFGSPIGPPRTSRPDFDFGFLGFLKKGKKKKDEYPSISIRERDRVLELEAELARFKSLKAEEEEKPPTRLPAPSKRKMTLD